MLNACPTCQRTFPEDEGSFCPADATKLVPLAEAPAPADPKDPLVGATVAGRFELRRIIADGAMGRVYEARELGPERRVAVKILHADVSEEPVNIERFKREAGTSRDLDHAHIVDVIDFDSVPTLPGRPGEVWYLAMEYLDGEELRALLDREKVQPLGRVVRLVSQIALALDPAHANGYVHRDMKPDNVFLVREGDALKVKLLDFGSVKFTKGQDKNNKLTVMGTTLGSPFYMSPEQAQGLPDLDHRADVWAVAVIVYEMVVGRVPFQGMNGPQILFKIIGDEPLPPSMASDTAPAELDDLMLKALQKNPADRYRTCGALADALGHALGLEGSHRDWAAKSEAELQAAIEAARAKPKSAPAPAATPSPERVSVPETSTADDTASIRPVKTGIPVWVYVAAALVAVGLGALLALR
jgi:serine/threonine-protein kinase